MTSIKKAAVLLFIMLFSFTNSALAKSLIVGCDTHLLPFEFKGDDGEYTGFDIDIWQTLASNMGLKYTLKPMDFKKLIPALQSGTIDVALGAITITAAREKIIDFSLPYFDSGLSVMVRADRNDIYGIGALTNKIIATKTATTSATFAGNIQQKKLLLFPDIESAYNEVLNGKADAVIYDSPALLYYINKKGGGKLKAVGERYHRQFYGIAFPQGSPLREKISIGLLELMEDGQYDSISRRWFGITP